VITAENAGRIEPLVNLEGFRDYGVDADISSDLSMIAAAGVWDGVILWSLQTGREIAHLKCSQQDAPALSVQFSQDTQYLAVSCGSVLEIWNVVQLLDEEAVRPEITLANANYSHSLTFGSDGRLIAAENHEGIRLWNIAAGQQSPEFFDEGDNICCPNFSPDGRSFAYIVGQKTHILDLNTLEVVDSWQFRSETFNANWTLGAGKPLANSNQELVVSIYDLSETVGDPIASLDGVNKSFTDVLTFSFSGQLVASASEWRGIVLWSSSSGESLVAFYDTPPVSSLNFSPDDRLLLSTHAGAGGLQYYVRLWGVRTEQGDNE
jgi:WD40 repeat protein